MSAYIQVQITFPDEESAGRTAKRLVECRLAACAQLAGPIRSTYFWRGKLETSNEILLLAKTKTQLFGRLVEEILAGHPYECPQIVALPIITGNDSYLAWLDEQTGIAMS